MSFTAPSENRKARGVAVHAGGPSFLDTVLFVHGDRVLLCFYSPAVQMRQSIIKLGDDREEVIWVELVGSQEAGCCLPVVCYLWSARYDCACLQHRFYGECRMWKSYAFFVIQYGRILFGFWSSTRAKSSNNAAPVPNKAQHKIQRLFHCLGKKKCCICSSFDFLHLVFFHSSLLCWHE